MTIDEAIENEKRRAESCKGHYDRFVQMEAEEHEQLAEWLEELKELRNMTSGHLYAVAFKNGYLKAEKEVREKTIDDFVRFASDMPTVETEDGEIRPMWLEEIAEQLKGAKQSEDFK